MKKINLHSGPFQMLIFGYIMGSDYRGVTPEQAIQEFLEGKDIEHRESDVAALLKMYEDFKETELYKAYQVG